MGNGGERRHGGVGRHTKGCQARTKDNRDSPETVSYIDRRLLVADPPRLQQLERAQMAEREIQRRLSKALHSLCLSPFTVEEEEQNAPD